MDYIHYEASEKNSVDAQNAIQAVEGITGIRGAATDDLYDMQEKAQNDRQEVNRCLNTVTCRIM